MGVAYFEKSGFYYFSYVFLIFKSSLFEIVSNVNPIA